MAGSVARPVVAVDVVVLGVWAGMVSVLLAPRAEEPFRGVPALPGVAVGGDELLLEAARRALVTKAGLTTAAVKGLHLEQLATFDGLYRDPRGRTISVAHLGLCRQPTATVGEPPAHWLALDAAVAGRLPFDHATIVGTALARLRGKLRYTNIASCLVEPEFRMDVLQGVYEAVLGHPLNRANFRTKLLRLGLIEDTGKVAEALGGGSGRPAHLYRFAREAVAAVDRDFL